MIPASEGVSHEARVKESHLPLSDWPTDEDSCHRRPLRIRRPRRRGYRFLNATTIGAVLGFLGIATLMFASATSQRGTKTYGDLLSALVAAAIVGVVGVVGAAVGTLGGWLFDTFIHFAIKAASDEGPSREDREDDEG